MESLIDYALKEKYNKVKKLRSRLEDMKELVEWNAFTPIFEKEKAATGRPSYDKILMLKILFLQGLYNISDEELEFQINDRMSFQQFLDFPRQIPDYSTIWRFREELIDLDVLDKLWEELQMQLNTQNIKMEKGVIQDAKFILAGPGKKSGMDNRGRTAKTSRSKDGTWTKKGKKCFFGFKLHTKIDKGNKLITGMALTTAKTHDGAIDLANEDEIVYRDKGYSGINTKAKGNATMKRGKLSPKDYLRNKRITKKRCRGEHQFGTMVRSFKAGTTRLTTLSRVFVQQLFVCLVYNVYRLNFLLS